MPKRFFIFPAEFEEGEALQQFRFTALMIMIILIIGYTLTFALLDVFGIYNVGVHERYVNVFHALSSIGVLLYLRRSKHHYANSLYVTLTFSFIAFSLALVFVPEDEFRAIWFFILIIGTYMVGDILLGVMISIASIVVILSLNFIFDLHISNGAFITTIVSFLSVSLFMYAYTKRIDKFQEELIEKNVILEHLATYDALTGIMNRRLFLEIAEKYLSEAERLSQHIYFLMVDIDRFKQINDTHGHFAGDEVLRCFSKVVDSMLRKADLFGRIGGEEFGVILLSNTFEEALATAERIREVVEDSECVIEGEELKITTSIGLVEGRASEPLAEIMKRADTVLYKAKSEGRNRVVASLNS